MKKIFILFTVIGFALVGCSNSFEEVVNKHGDIQNLEGLDRFVKNVESQNKAKINYISYGIEGQRS